MKRLLSAFKRLSLQAKIILSVTFVFFLLYSVSLIYPIVWTFFNSLKSTQDFYDYPFDLPREWLFSNYKRAFLSIRAGRTTFIGLFVNSIWMTALSTFVSILFSTMTAYAVAKYEFPGRSFLYSVAIFIQVIPLVGSGTAMYRLLHAWGIANNPALIWVIWAGGFTFAFLVLYGYFKSVSWTYAEAAFVDGAGNWRVFLQIMIPQAKPAIISLAIISLIGNWNDYMTPMLYMDDYPTLALGMYIIRESSSFDYAGGKPVFFAALLISIAPIVAIFIAFQKTIMENTVAGGLKG